MKKIILIIIWILLTCNILNGEEIAENHNVAEKIKNKLIVSVDPRVEMLSIVQYLAKDNNTVGVTNIGTTPYYNRIEKYFNKYKNHEAVKMYKELNDIGFSFHVPPSMVLHLNMNFEEENKIEENDLIERCGGDEKRKEFAKLLSKFYKDTGFQKFYNDNYNYYIYIINEYLNSQKKDYVDLLENFYGRNQKSYHTILVALYRGNYGIRIKNNDNIYNIIAPTNYDKDGNVLFVDIVTFHEFSHSYINPLSEKYSKEIYKNIQLYEPIANDMYKQAYGTWETCINEHIVRAVDILLSEKIDGADKTNTKIEVEKIKKFLYIDKIIESLRNYEKNREKFKTIDEYYPELLKVLDEYAKIPTVEITTEKDFDKVINSYFTNYGKFILILPTNEEDKKIQADIRKNAKKIMLEIGNKIGKTIEVIDDKKVKESDLVDSNIIVLGTISGNKYYEKFKMELPFNIKENEINIAGKKVEGENLEIITCIKNPLNSKRGILIVTGQKTENILVEIPNEATEYAINNSLKNIEKGFYK